MEAEKDLQPQVVAEAASNPKKAENPVKVVVTSNGGSDEELGGSFGNHYDALASLAVPHKGEEDDSDTDSDSDDYSDDTDSDYDDRELQHALSEDGKDDFSSDTDEDGKASGNANPKSAKQPGSARLQTRLVPSQTARSSRPSAAALKTNPRPQNKAQEREARRAEKRREKKERKLAEYYDRRHKHKLERAEKRAMKGPGGRALGHDKGVIYTKDDSPPPSTGFRYHDRSSQPKRQRSRSLLATESGHVERNHHHRNQQYVNITSQTYRPPIEPASATEPMVDPDSSVVQEIVSRARSRSLNQQEVQSAVAEAGANGNTAHTDPIVLVTDPLEFFEEPEDPDDQSDITDVKKYYVLGDVIEVEEDRENEFKAVQRAKNPISAIADHVKKYCNAFLNTDGGTIYFGVEDDGYIAGIHIGRKERDLLRLRIDAAISAYRPQVDPDIVKVDFVPVLFPEKDTKPRERNSASRFVVVVRVYKGIAPVYVFSDSTAYFRRSGSVYQMNKDMVEQRTKYGRPLYKGNSPMVPLNFIGREEEIASIRDFLGSNKNLAAMKFIVLHGSPLVGKSALAKQLVFTFSSMYPDRHLVVDMRGVTSNYISIEDAMATVIRTVFPTGQIPTALAELQGLYQSCFAGKRCIFLIENAGYRNQIEKLAPALAKSCLVLITSRKDLQLSGEFEALEIKLGALGPTNAIKLLTSVSKSAIDPDDAAEIVKLCGYLPLPIRIVGSTLARSPNVTPKEMIKHLSDESKRLELLAASPFHAAFDLYPEDVKKHLMAISVFPGSFDIEAAQAVFGLSAVDTQAKLTMLIELNEIEYNVVSGRYMQNDLLRLYCQKKAEADSAQLALWHQNFARHYLRMLNKAMTLCEVSISRKQGFELFAAEGHNIEAAIHYSYKSKNYTVCSKYLYILQSFSKFVRNAAGNKWQELISPILKQLEQVQEGSRTTPPPLPELNIPARLAASRPVSPTGEIMPSATSTLSVAISPQSLLGALTEEASSCSILAPAQDGLVHSQPSKSGTSPNMIHFIPPGPDSIALAPASTLDQSQSRTPPPFDKSDEASDVESQANINIPTSAPIPVPSSEQSSHPFQHVLAISPPSSQEPRLIHVDHPGIDRHGLPSQGK